MKALFLIGLCTCILGFLGGCASPSTVDYDERVLETMRAYRSFTVEHNELSSAAPHQSLTELTERRIAEAIEASLTARNMTVETEQPDCILSYFTTTQTKTSVHDTLVGGSYAVRSPYRHRGGWGSLSTPMIDQYEEGTLIIEVLDGQNRS